MADKKQSFGINTGLIAGAGLVARSEGVGKLAGAEALQDVGAFLAEGIGKVVKARNREFNKLLANQLNQPGLTEDQVDAMEKRLQKQRFKYVYLNDRRLRRKEEQKVEKEAKAIVDDVNDKNEVASTAQNVVKENPESLGVTDQTNVKLSLKNSITDESGNNVKIIQTEDIKDNDGNVIVPLVNIYKGEKETGVAEKFIQSYYDKFLDPNSIFNNLGDGEGAEKIDMDPKIPKAGKDAYRETGVINFPNIAEGENGLPLGLEFVTNSEFIDIINSKGVDEATIAKYKANVDQQINNARNLKPGERVDFRYEMEFDKQKTFVADGNAISIATNNIIGNRNFKKDLIKGLQSGTYKSLGINLTDEEIKKLDKNGGKVTKEDSIKMAEELIYNSDYRELFENTLSSFLTNVTEQIYKANLDPLVLATMQDKPQFMSKEQAAQTEELIEAQKRSLQQQQTEKNTYDPGKGLGFLTQ